MNLEQLAQIGLTPEVIEEKVVYRIVETILTSIGVDDEGETYPSKSAIAMRLEKQVREKVDAAVDAKVEQITLGLIEQKLNELTLPKTNKFGEPKGAPRTFAEYTTDRARQWLEERVDSRGEPVSSSSSYSLPKGQPRLAHLVDKSVDGRFETAIRDVLRLANDQFAEQVRTTLTDTVTQVADKIKITVR